MEDIAFGTREKKAYSLKLQIEIPPAPFRVGATGGIGRELTKLLLFLLNLQFLVIMKKDNPYHDESMWKGASANTFSKAENLRNNMTEAESILWDAIKDNKLMGYKFRRQHPIHLFIADFYCHKLKLVIEIDGEYHNIKSQSIKDNERTTYLNAQGIQIIRFTNKEVINKLDEVIKKITKQISKALLP